MPQRTAIIRITTTQEQAASELYDYLGDVVNPDAPTLIDQFISSCSNVAGGYLRIAFDVDWIPYLQQLSATIVHENFELVTIEHDGQDVDFDCGEYEIDDEFGKRTVKHRLVILTTVPLLVKDNGI